MELRRIALLLAFFVVAVCSQCSDAHTMRKRGAEDGDYDENLMGDEGPTDDEAQNDDRGDEKETPPETIITQPTSYNVTVGRTVRLECKVSPNNRPVIQWSKDGQPLFMGQARFPMAQLEMPERLNVSIATNDLLIVDVRPADSGKYKCTVIQAQQTSIEHVIAVQEAPRIIRYTVSDNGVVMEGSELVLRCDVAGSPAPTIIWSRDNGAGNVRLTEADAIFTLNTATIKNVRREKAGKYYCFVFNALGSTQSEHNVKVLHKPHVQVHKTVVNSALEVEAILQCVAHAEPAPRITWYKDGSMIDPFSPYVVSTDGPHSNLTVTPHQDSDFGTFTCVATNSHGKHNRSIELVQRPVVEGVELEGNKLSWRVHSHQPLRKVELQLRDTEAVVTTLNVPLPEDTNKHEIEFIYALENVTPGKYEVVVKAENSKEWSRESEPVIVDYVYHGNSHSIRPASSVILSSAFMYLLVRMF
ncbi:lachesin-like isoform X2 [Ostrinia nubilalis]|uniref:lachesin-like isoform X2 n=1 Tax=Ostrinia nubilalis TaxID=29057 RepID=UPI0030822E41